MNQFMQTFEKSIRLCIINLDKEGPNIKYRETIPWKDMDAYELQSYYTRLALDTVILGLREEYSSSLADLPAPGTDKWRIKVITIMEDRSIEDSDSKPQHEKFIQLILLISNELQQNLPSIVNYEKKLLNKIRSLISPDTPITDNLITLLKKQICNQLLLQLDL